MKRKKWVIVIGFIVIGLGVSMFGFGYKFSKPGGDILSPVGKVTEKSLDNYTFENLKNRDYKPSQITFEKLLKTNTEFSVWMFSFNSDGKKITGAANLPSGVSTQSGFINPVIVMLRGFATPEDYYPGFGTERVAGELAKNGYVTFAPDFLGYGESDKEADDVFEGRFQTYTTTLNLIVSICHSGVRLGRTIESPTTKDPIASPATAGSLQDDKNCHMALWGHSNGGQIALSVLAISGKPYPTVLWNPVSITFPYSILYYTYDNKDQGKAIRKNLAILEKDYDTMMYDPANYFDWITGPILLQQGELDELVPRKWSDELTKKLEKTDKKINYKIYAGSDHNLMPKWGEAVIEAVKFYDSSLKPARAK